VLLAFVVVFLRTNTHGQVETFHHWNKYRKYRFEQNRRTCSLCSRVCCCILSLLKLGI